MHFSINTIIAVVATLSTVAALPRSHASVEARADGAIDCDTPRDTAGNKLGQGNQEREHFVEGQNYLRKLDGVNVSGKTCSRVSCSNSAAVWLCNDGDNEIGVTGPTMANYIDNIFDQCQMDGLYAVDYATGSRGNTDSWHLSVGKDSC